MDRTNGKKESNHDPALEQVKGDVYACQPSYGPGVSASHMQFWRHGIVKGDPLQHLQVILDNEGSSLLPDCFNSHWTKALNLQLQGKPIKWFVMCHDDVIPEHNWISKLVQLQLRTEADLVAAVVQIKDSRALTSTALEDLRDPWETWRRITMLEVGKLPQTFTAEDCQMIFGEPELHPLMANTGCWICDFTKPWRFKVCFENPCRNVFITEGGEIIPIEDYEPGMKGSFNHQTMPEDWDFSRKLRKLGATVVCTREVAVGHMGHVLLSNQDILPREGRWDKDQYLRRKFDPTIRDVPDVEGLISEKEGRFLAGFCRGLDVLEIGCWKGYSTVWMGRTAKSMTVIDTFRGDTDGTPSGDVLQIFLDTLKKYDLQNKVGVVQSDSSLALKFADEDNPNPKTYDLVFIDANHSKETVLNDIKLSSKLLKPGGGIMLHDYGNLKDPGVRAAVDALLLTGEWEFIHKVESIAIIAPLATKVTNQNLKQTAIGVK